MVAQGAGLDADHVEDGDVGTADGCAHLSAGGKIGAYGGAERVLQAGVFGGKEEGARNVAVT